MEDMKEGTNMIIQVECRFVIPVEVPGRHAEDVCRDRYEAAMDAKYQAWKDQGVD